MLKMMCRQIVLSVRQSKEFKIKIEVTSALAAD